MPPRSPRRWRLAPQDETHAQGLCRTLGLQPLTAQILDARGLSSPDQARTHLDPSFDHLHDPMLMAGMERAIRRTLEAFRDRDPILVFGDSDVDGITAAVCVYQFLDRLGVEVQALIPARSDEGYGLTESHVRQAYAQGTRLLITTDCGLGNHASIELAAQLGLDVIVIDHHTMPDELPPAAAILNPLQDGCRFPFKRLAAVGVAFNYIMALRRSLIGHGAFPGGPPDLLQYMDIVALGTVADAVPLIDENRTFVRLGLEVLGRRHRPGVQALMDRAQVEEQPVTARTIGYRLAPLINAAGRMGDANRCVELLSTDSFRKALRLARELERDNTRRQQREREMLREATRMAELQIEEGRHLLLLAGSAWHEGVLGIVASRIKEAFHRPAALVAIKPDSGLARASLRAIEGIDLIAALSQARHLLRSWGGHTAAAGMTLSAEHLDEVDRILNEDIGRQLPLVPPPQLHLDARCCLMDLDDAFLMELERLAPFGVGNPEPLLLVENVRCVRRRVVGERHLRLQLRDGNTTLDAIGFALADKIDQLSGPLDLAVTPRVSIYCGRPRLELQVQDLRPHSPDAWEPTPATVHGARDHA